ncbi:MAG: MarR family winged helix-turn-helix transcriptional regulator [Lachnospirales bacterium]
MQEKKQELTRNISILSNRVRRKLDDLSIRGEYTSTQGKILFFLLANEDTDIFQKDIEEQYGVRPPSATELLKKMEANGLITRDRVSYDARLKKIVVTEKAKAYRKQVFEECENYENEVTDGLSEDEIDVFNKLLGKIIKNLK